VQSKQTYTHTTHISSIAEEKKDIAVKVGRRFSFSVSVSRALGVVKVFNNNRNTRI